MRNQLILTFFLVSFTGYAVKNFTHDKSKSLGYPSDQLICTAEKCDLNVPATPSTLSDNKTVIDSFKNVRGHEGPVLIRFKMEGCAPCAAMDKVFDSLKEEIKAKNFKIVEIELDENIINDKTVMALIRRFKIEGVPAFFLYKNGKDLSPDAVINQRVGAMPTSKTKEFLGLDP
jgi:thiol-disulfide isomerase/thioredoxin